MTGGGSPYADGNHNDPYGHQPYGGYGQQYDGYGQQYGAPDGGYGRPGGADDPFPHGAHHNQMGATTGISPTDAISTGWHLFKNNPVPWLLMVLLTLVVGGVSSALTDPDPTSGTTTFANLFSAVFSVLLHAFMIRGALLEVDGLKPGIGDFFKLTNFGWYLLTSVLVGIATVIGVVALVIGAVVVAFFLYWSTTFAIDRNMNASDAIVSSFNAVKSDGGNLFALAVLNVLLMIAGALAFMVGMFIALPVTMLASIYAYRTITGPSAFSSRAASGV